MTDMLASNKNDRRFSTVIRTMKITSLKRDCKNVQH